VVIGQVNGSGAKKEILWSIYKNWR